MYRAIIVEDELLVRVAYQSIVNWQDYGFELVGLFENGQAALDAFDEIQPDFVLTDTKMPVCDGITLIREVKRRSADTICVILSAYGDLNYVKDGIREGADDYLLKLDITREKLGELLKSTAQKLDQMRKSEVRSVSQERAKGRDRFLRSWIRGEYQDKETIRDYLKFYGIKLYHEQLVCMSVHIDELDGGIQKTPSETVSSAIRQTISETLRSTGVWLLIDMRASLLYCVGCCDGTDARKFGEHMQESVLFALKSVMNLSKVTIQFGIADSLSDVSAVFGKLHLTGEKMTCDGFADQTAEQVERLVAHILHFRYGQATESLRRLNESFSRVSDLSVEIMRNHCSYILMAVNSAKGRDPILESHFKNVYPRLKADLWNSYFPREICRWIDQLCTHMEQMEQTRAPSASLAGRAAAYIQAHYTEDLSLDVIAGHIRVSPTYLSRIFTQEKGVGIQEYLTDLRLRKAKELLAQTNDRVYEIAIKVGYSDAVYFNKVFKKHTGKTPKEYRRMK